jgi:hypothetical protein
MSENPMNEMPVSMDCAAFAKISHHLYRPDVAEAAICEAALAHAESCSRCATLLTAVEWLEFSMLDLARHSANRQISPRVESALLQEFRRQKADVARRQIHWRLAALGIAAALFLAIGLALRHRTVLSPASSSAPAADAAASHSLPAIAPTPLQSPAQTTGAKVPELPAPRQHVARKQSVPSAASDAEDASAFVPLPYADDSAALDGGAVVRVSLSRSALASFGLPVADFASSDRIQADLIVGADGTPQAIRLLSQLNPSEDF